MSKRARGCVAGLTLWIGAALALGPVRIREARAEGPLGKDGDPIRTSDYGLDLFQGPVLASSRIMALGGAYSALAEGADGISVNAASVSQRYPYSTSRTDYDVTAGLTFPSSVSRTDFDNNGKSGFGYSDFLFATAGALLQHGPFGIGTSVSVQNYSLDTPVDQQSRTTVRGVTVRLFKFDTVAAYALAHDQLHVGGGLRGGFITTSTGSVPLFGETLLFGSYGVGAQGGVLWTPHDLPLRLGATLRSPVIGSVSLSPNAQETPGGDRLIGGMYLPTGADLPWEGEWGVAFQIGPRPLNIPWVDEDKLLDEEVLAGRRIYAETGELEPAYRSARRILRRRYRSIPRRKLLVSLSMLATGPTENAVGVESMLAQIVERSGQRFSYTFRGGVESEVIPHRLQLRAGGYMEPTRFARSTERVHATGGFEVRVIDWSVFGIFDQDATWRISGAVDGSRGYFGWSLAIGLWR